MTKKTVEQLQEEKARIEALIAEASKKDLNEGDEVVEVSVKKDTKDSKKDKKDDDSDSDDDKDDVKESVKAKLAARLESYIQSEQPATDNTGVDPLTGKARTTSKDTVLPGHDGNESHVVNGENGAPAQTITPHLTQEDISAIFQGAELSEDVKNKTRVVFEAAVNAQVAQKVSNLKEAALKALEESVEEIEEGLLGKVDEFLGYVTTEWVAENKLAMDSSLQLEIYEDFFSGLKNLYLEHNITIPEGKVDVLESAKKDLAEVTKKLDEATAKLIAQDKVILEGKKSKVIAELCEGLVATQAEKLKTLVEDIEAKDEKTFREKATIVKESYFKDSAKPAAKTPDGTKVIAESVNSSVAKYAESLKKINNPQ